MGKCVNHPGRETNFVCMKHNHYLCEECLKCVDPNIHCKFRSSCPIWFMEKRGGKGIDDVPFSKTKEHTVVFQPDNKEVRVPEGATLLYAAQLGDVPLNASCNGKGSCGKCKLILESGTAKSATTPLLTPAEKGKNYVLACQTTVHCDIVVRIPEETLEKKLKIAGMGKAATDRMRGLVTDITPMLAHFSLELSPPTLDDSISDMDRLLRGLSRNGCDVSRMSAGLTVMRELAAAMRDENWKVTASVVKKRFSSEIVGVVPGNGRAGSLGLAIDVGTTSIVVYLVDMKDGTVMAATSSHNRQAACGDDVINRIVCAEKDGVKKLSDMGLATINGLINEAIAGAEIDRDRIDNVVLSGNTTMVHLLLRIEPRHIRREPYVPSVSAFPILKAGSVGLKVNPEAAVFVMPGPAGYVGGDIVSGLIYTGFHREDPLTLFIDVGTNGEIVLGNKDWLMTASCSAGPAFEGGGIRWGMRAEEGAIEKVTIDPETLVPAISVVEDVLPRGICGSGMIDLISEMVRAGIIQQNGKFTRDAGHPRITKDGDEPAYILAFAGETSVDKDILFMESDVENIIRSKGAVYAGFKVLLHQAGLDISMIDRMIITGGFGQYLDLEKAVSIGLLPDIDRRKFKYMGNSSIAGAYMALLSEAHRKEAVEICNRMTYIDFSSNNRFMEEFTSALFIPHTNLEEFPSVKRKFQ
ncbi:MAG: ferredoxin [Desulfobacterales bacterium CG23_combo_of_CG06-09_8_20_14_all_51_8]|nr:MAG: ferredoxin [Desulfobacterales bacterium CG23_combo_of_CG06-09_8_20_14_all_51_8]